MQEALYRNGGTLFGADRLTNTLPGSGAIRSRMRDLFTHKEEM